MEKHTGPLAYFGSAVTFVTGIINQYGLTWADIGTIAGILFGLFTLLINWYYKQKDYELHKLEIEKGQQRNEKDRH